MVLSEKKKRHFENILTFRYFCLNFQLERKIILVILLLMDQVYVGFRYINYLNSILVLIVIFL